MEFVIHADQNGLGNRLDVQSFASREQAGSGDEVLTGLVFDPIIIPLREYRPIGRKHVFGADANGHSGQGVAGGLGESAAWLVHGVAILRERHAALCVTEELRRPEIADPAGRGADGSEVVGLREGREVREGMPAVDVAEVEHALHAEHEVLAGQEVTTGLNAADDAAIVFTAAEFNGSGRRPEIILR